mmetsp:Transcript_13117/g.35971  ORF Transcript_13117/g.35971 Transcript_13117/m.35971 type:complete len:185 (-) Transcript_13117:295-849(-)
MGHAGHQRRPRRYTRAGPTLRPGAARARADDARAPRVLGAELRLRAARRRNAVRGREDGAQDQIGGPQEDSDPRCGVPGRALRCDGGVPRLQAKPLRPNNAGEEFDAASGVALDNGSSAAPPGETRDGDCAARAEALMAPRPAARTGPGDAERRKPDFVPGACTCCNWRIEGLWDELLRDMLRH